MPKTLLAVSHLRQRAAADCLNDPYFAEAPQPVSRAAFELSLLRFDYRCAILAV